MSYIVSQQSLDNQGRINIGNLYESNPAQIVVAVEAETKRILFFTPEQAQGWGVVQNVDNKSRIVLPKWLREELGEDARLNLVIETAENGEIRRYAKLKTNSILSE